MQQPSRSAETRGRRAPPAAAARVSPRAADAPEGSLRPLPGLRYGVLDTLMGYALRRAQNALYLDFQRAVGDDVSPQRFAALVLIVGNPGLRQGLLAEAMGLHRSGGMRLVDWLHAQGWVRRFVVCAQGSRFTYSVAPSARPPSRLPRATASACGAPARSW